MSTEHEYSDGPAITDEVVEAANEVYWSVFDEGHRNGAVSPSSDALHAAIDMVAPFLVADACCEAAQAVARVRALAAQRDAGFPEVPYMTVEEVLAQLGPRQPCETAPATDRPTAPSDSTGWCNHCQSFGHQWGAKAESRE